MTKPQDIDLKELRVNSASYNPNNKLKFDIIGDDAIKQFLANKLNRIENEIDVWKEKQCDCFDDNKNKADEECFSCSQLRIVNKLIRKEFTK